MATGQFYSHKNDMNESSTFENSPPKVNLDNGEKIVWSGQPDPKVFRFKEVSTAIICMVFGIGMLPLPYLFWLDDVQTDFWSDFSTWQKVLVVVTQILIWLPVCAMFLYHGCKPFFDYLRK